MYFFSLKGEHIIIANEGPNKNVLFITPPMCFALENAHTVIKTLDRILSQLEKEDDSLEFQQSNEQSFNPYSITGPRTITGDR